MNIDELRNIITNHENENLEFKKAKNSFSVLGGDKQNRKSVYGYCVAIGNESGGKLIFGVEDKTKKIIGTKALPNIEEIKSQIFIKLQKRIKIEEIYDENSKRIVVVTIPSRPLGKTFKFYDIPLMRVGEQLKAMDDETLKNILDETKEDWSAKTIPDATIDDLDEEAIIIARENFKTKNPKLINDIDKWSNETFLNKAKLTKKGKITNTAIILLGKSEARDLISPAVAQITWILKDKNNNKKDYEHFHCPFILSVGKVYQKIRNLKYRYMKNDSLFPDEIDMYDSKTIREALHNCIAHQDYSMSGKIHVVENEDGFLVFTNKGRFLPKSIEYVIETDSPFEIYRNKFLVDAMVNLNMIDTIGSGIKDMFERQRDRYFPMPEYDLSEQRVSVKIIGKVLDVNYARLLAKNKNLKLEEIRLLDAVQKKKKITKEQAQDLKKKKYIDGRYPHVYIAKDIAKNTGEKANYIKNKAFDNKYYSDLIVEYLKKYKQASRKEIDILLLPKVSEILALKEKRNKIRNLLHSMSKKGLIINYGKGPKSIWKIRQ